MTAMKGALLGVLGAMVVGCGPSEEALVLEVGPEQVTVGEFERLFWEASRRDSTLGPDSAGLQKFAEEEAEARLLYLLSLEYMPDLEHARLDRLLDYEQTQAVERLRDVEYGDAYFISDSEIEQAYERLGKMRRLRRVVVASEAEARNLARAVREGALFDRMAASVALDERTRASGGDLGWLTYADVPDMDRGVLFDAEVGSVVGPQPAGRGWAVYQVVEQSENPSRGTLAEERDRLRELLIRQHVQVARAEYETDLFEKYNYRVHPAEIAWLTFEMKENTSGASRGTDVLNDETAEERNGVVYTRSRVPWQGNPVAPADSARVIAEFDHENGQIHPGIVYLHLASKPVPTWPEFDSSADVERLVRELVLERIEQWEATQRDYANSPEVAQKVQKLERDIRRRQFNRNIIRTPLIPEEEEIRAEYDRRIAEFTEPERRSFLAVNVSNREAAERVAELLREGRAVSQLPLEFAESDALASTGNDGTPLMTREEAGPVLADVLFQLPKGEVSQPIPVGDTFTVAKVVEVEEAHVVPFEDVKIDIQVEMVDERSVGKKAELLEEARTNYPVTIHQDALAKVRPVDPRREG